MSDAEDVPAQASESQREDAADTVAVTDPLTAQAQGNETAGADDVDEAADVSAQDGDNGDAQVEEDDDKDDEAKPAIEGEDAIEAEIEAKGDVEGEGEGEDSSPGAESKENSDFIEHLVQITDSISSLALRYNVDKSDITRANRLSTDRDLCTRKTISIPKKRGLYRLGSQENISLTKVDKKADQAEEVIKEEEARTASPPPKPINYIIHEVQLSDTLRGLALKYNTQVADIKRANKLFSDAIISYPRLIIPTEPLHRNSEIPSLDDTRKDWGKDQWDLEDKGKGTDDDMVQYRVIEELPSKTRRRKSSSRSRASSTASSGSLRNDAGASPSGTSGSTLRRESPVSSPQNVRKTSGSLAKKLNKADEELYQL
eukprot:GFYU01013585.1.p1 GENE.GFYU01013585.1~~GFYU01013585.1.p1  ORF type:complete len:372 (-),score=72.54 GFYU01013585.1:194-1309(-)